MKALNIFRYVVVILSLCFSVKYTSTAWDNPELTQTQVFRKLLGVEK